jgi:vitamin-K-epoxide reductase (warfarin-sensitive)
MITISLIIALIGLAISLYGINVERKLQQNAQYKAACDINDSISCSKPMLSEYNKMFGISNIWASALYYCAIIALILLNLPKLTLLLACAGVAVSAVFAYILYFKIQSLCLICTSLYIVNIALACALFFS